MNARIVGTDTARRGAPLHGAFLVDKPPGMTSASVLRTLERAWRIKGLGHAGTLDPMATGLLIVLAGAATRLQMLFLESGKEYEGRIRVGTGTETDDIEGAVICTDDARAFLERASLAEWRERIRSAFSGTITQVPPQYSAVKVAGRKSYEVARRGGETELRAREVQVQFLELDFESDSSLRYRVHCSKGTYVRSLARDIGSYLGSCACLESIRRTASGAYRVEDAYTLDELTGSVPESRLLDMETLTASLPSFVLGEEECVRLKQGDQRMLHRAEPEGPPSCYASIVGQDRAFQGVAERAEGECWRVRFLLP